VTTVISESGSFEVHTGHGLWMSASECERVTGWTAKPQGMCKADECVPLPAGSTRDGQVDVAAFWRWRSAPVLSSDAGDAWVLGESAQTRNQILLGETAPDFTLPDVAGTPRTLSSLRGNKVVLVTWASW